MTGVIELQARLPYTLKKTKVGFVAFCPILDVGSQGDNEQEAIENLKEAIEAFIEGCAEMGTLDDVLRECGFKPFKVKKAKPVEFTEPTICVPIPLLMNQSSQVRCRG